VGNIMARNTELFDSFVNVFSNLRSLIQVLLFQIPGGGNPNDSAIEPRAKLFINMRSVQT
jgi:hypothetical protein